MINRRVGVLAGGVAVLAMAAWYRPPRELGAVAAPPGAAGPVPAVVPALAPVPRVTAADAAFGRSGEVRMRFVRAGERVAFPVAVDGVLAGFRYQWRRVGDNQPGDRPRLLVGDTLLAPLAPGFYELEVERQGVAQRIAEPRLAVLVPFEVKLGSTLNGYRIGHWPAEWSGDGEAERPPGFVEVFEGDLALPLTRHVRLGDFVAHDAQRTWPRYVAIDPRVLDKLELVLGELARRRGQAAMDFSVSVHSGFRTPLHNAGVEGAARDSRHLYGDAADVAIDADGDGRLTITDAYHVERAVEWIESTHPDLVGGLGVYSSPGYPTPYCHIDARGERKRWRG